MWNLNLEMIKSRIAAPTGLPDLAIETGTCRGNGTKGLARNFKRVITIELSEFLFSETRSRLSGLDFGHVDFVRGDSGSLLPDLLDSLPNRPIFFFLDAHWSGDRTVKWEFAEWKGYGIDTAHLAPMGCHPSGPQQCPLQCELEAIVGHCK